MPNPTVNTCTRRKPGNRTLANLLVLAYFEFFWGYRVQGGTMRNITERTFQENFLHVKIFY